MMEQLQEAYRVALQRIPEEHRRDAELAAEAAMRFAEIASFEDEINHLAARRMKKDQLSTMSQVVVDQILRGGTDLSGAIDPSNQPQK